MSISATWRRFSPTATAAPTSSIGTRCSFSGRARCRVVAPAGDARYHRRVTPQYDVIILGGAFSGASAAILLRREHPHLRVLIVEKANAFDEKVGEATTEMSAMFL